MAVTVITLYFCSVGEWFQMKKTVSSQIWSLHYFILQHILSSPLSSIRPLSSLLFIGLILSPMEIQEHCRDPAGSKGSTTCCAERMVYWCVALLPRFNFPVSYAPLSQNRVSYYLQAAAYLCQHLQSGLTLLILHWLRADTVPFCAVITSGISHKYTKWCCMEIHAPAGLVQQLCKADPSAIHGSETPRTAYSTWVFIWWG